MIASLIFGYLFANFYNKFYSDEQSQQNIFCIKKVPFSRYSKFYFISLSPLAAPASIATIPPIIGPAPRV